MNKKITIILIALIGFSFSSQAQVNPNALGVRLGGNGYYNDAELSYQLGVGSQNRFEFDFGFRQRKYYNNMSFTATYQWDWNIVNGLNWYVGPGAAIGFYNWDDKHNRKQSGTSLALGGQIGLEYDFKKEGAPILISLDSRPMFDFVGYNYGFGWGAALGVRYVW